MKYRWVVFFPHELLKLFKLIRHFLKITFLIPQDIFFKISHLLSFSLKLWLWLYFRLMIWQACETSVDIRFAISLVNVRLTLERSILFVASSFLHGFLDLLNSLHEVRLRRVVFIFGILRVIAFEASVFTFSAKPNRSRVLRRSWTLKALISVRAVRFLC